MSLNAWRPGARALGRGLLLALVATCARSARGDTPGQAAPGTGSVQKDAERDARRAEVRFPHGRLFIAEIADTPERQQRGYMFRTDVGEQDAMIFVFPQADFHSFWMKNTLMPLDMIWMDDAFTVVHIEASVPPCKADPCPDYGPPRKARYVLEVRGGVTRRERLAIGDHLKISFPQATVGNLSRVRPPAVAEDRDASLTARRVRRKESNTSRGGGA